MSVRGNPYVVYFFLILLSPLNCISLTTFSLCILIKIYHGATPSLDSTATLVGLSCIPLILSATTFTIFLSFWFFLVKLSTSSILSHSTKFHHQWYYFSWIHFTYFNIQSHFLKELPMPSDKIKHFIFHLYLLQLLKFLETL